MTSLTYGTIPSKDEFYEAFDRKVEGLRYPIKLSSSDARATEDVPGFGDDEYTASELYRAVENLTKAWSDMGNDEAGDIASSILFTLGFEWV